MAVKNMAVSVLTRLKQQSKKEGMLFQLVLQLFVQEEFLRKLAISNYVEKMILKGGMFIYTLTEFDSRPTKDIDFLIRNLSNDLDNIRSVMEEICRVDTGNEFITIEALEMERITVDKKYSGVKMKFMGHINNVRIPFSIDIGVDDVIVPNPVKRKILTRLSNFKAPEVYTYSLESTIAEKLDAILERMEATSRMKDFYDIYYLSRMFNFDGAILIKAIYATLEHRNRELLPDAFDIIAGFINSEFLNIQWKAFEPARNIELEFGTVLIQLETFLKPVYEAVLNQREYTLQWDCKVLEWS